ncbi:hypothetical protein B0H66DRAFT_535198 [Apodospora peruviana]|uniref:Ubiquitin carboxyl-terminal hydrolase n=1 Tax=Apodospora peruviana TaxID=516989 RepID=A0AAE0I248_9PEZI|nr:hypothetical protein B0H66DRAFT_535198 [Apodospora peruviana]
MAASIQICEHVKPENLRTPKYNSSVYREDCTRCFDSIDDEGGLDVCLRCWNGGCTGRNDHSHDHYENFHHPLVLNIRRVRKVIERDEPPLKISKLAIEAETEADRYDNILTVRCLVCGQKELDKTDSRIAPVVDHIMTADAYAKKQEILAWQMDLEPCEHVNKLVEGPVEKFPPLEEHCNNCDLKANLWLCLECGNLGCGRAQVGGADGNSHGMAHYEETGHGVAIKLGSLSEDRVPDIWCYTCNEDRIHNNIMAFLRNKGLNPAHRQSTEKSQIEMNIEQNFGGFNFSMTGGDGTESTPLFGPGLTGLRNLGNTCYFASILQCLFDMPSFQKRFNLPTNGKKKKPAQDLETQLRRMANGLLSGRYSKEDPDVEITEHSSGVRHQKGLAPVMLKHLIGKGHEEFSGMKQQDAQELMQYLLDKISRLKHPSELGGDPAQPMRFVMEQRLQCQECKRVRLKPMVQENVFINVPAEKLPLEDGEEKQKYKPYTLKECLDILTAPEEVEFRCTACPSRSFTKRELFKTFPQVLVVVARKYVTNNFTGQSEKVEVPVIVGDETFGMDDSYFSKGLQPGEEPLPEEAEAAPPQSAPEAAAPKPAPEPTEPAFEPDPELLGTMLSFGFEEGHATRICYEIKNKGGVEAALAWAEDHANDADYTDSLEQVLAKKSVAAEPMEVRTTAGPSAKEQKQREKAEKEEQIDMFMMMLDGQITREQATKAIAKLGGADNAMNWIFSNGVENLDAELAKYPDAQPDADDAESSAEDEDSNGEEQQPAVGNLVPGSDERPALYQLQSIVCHKGPSINSGHYVAFIRKEVDREKIWVLFNDEKVVRAVDAEEMKKTAYVYFFTRESYGAALMDKNDSELLEMLNGVKTKLIAANRKLELELIVELTNVNRKLMDEIRRIRGSSPNPSESESGLDEPPETELSSSVMETELS